MSIVMQDVQIISKARAIICFGPATDVSGFKAGEYFQVVIDPEMLSPSGEYIRFNAGDECEVHGWQRVAGITVCEILDEGPKNVLGKVVVVRAIVKE